MFLLVKIKNLLVLLLHIAVLLMVGFVWITLTALQQNPNRIQSVAIEDASEESDRHDKRRPSSQ